MQNEQIMIAGRRFAQGFAFGVSYTGMTRRLLSLYDPFLSEADNKARNYNYSTNAGNQTRSAFSNSVVSVANGFTVMFSYVVGGATNADGVACDDGRSAGGASRRLRRTR